MIIIGNTPEQLGSVTTANALIIDGKAFTKEQVIALQAERYALAAQVGAFAAMIIEVRSADESKDFLGSDWHERSDALIASTPEHHLAAHDAEVAEAAFIEGASSFDCDSSLHTQEVELAAKEYAAQLRAKAKL